MNSNISDCLTMYEHALRDHWEKPHNIGLRREKDRCRKELVQEIENLEDIRTDDDTEHMAEVGRDFMDLVNRVQV